MIVKRIVRTEDGQIEATLMLTGEQAAYLINTGLAVLVQRGAVELRDMSEEEYRQQQAQQAANEAVVEQAPAEPTTVSPSSSEQVQESEKERKARELAFLQAVDIEHLPKA